MTDKQKAILETAVRLVAANPTRYYGSMTTIFKAQAAVKHATELYDDAENAGFDEEESNKVECQRG